VDSRLFWQYFGEHCFENQEKKTTVKIGFPFHNQGEQVSRCFSIDRKHIEAYLPHE
jgi:hypothetical protein